ncbi:unnamed protein product [Cuscuta epithymum]|uniref:TF-B3 domain-containing protein n=1 Tax=Cuscuta epithymum TaxID=186058 RepID=A0AAV0CNM4_9ASTE|nr:unnamed protein product [Cuscuta epithymum]
MVFLYDFLATFNEKEKGVVGDDAATAAAVFDFMGVAAEAASVESVSTELCLFLCPPQPSLTKLINLPDNEDETLTLRLSPPDSNTSTLTTRKRKTSSPCLEATPGSKRSRTSKCSKSSEKREGSGDSEVHQNPSPRAGALGEGGGEGPWVKKMLSASDVNSSSRLLLPKAEIMDRYVLPSLDREKESACHSAMGLRVKVTDMDDGKECVLTLLQWKSGSFVLTNNWSEKFVRRRLLKEGDSIELCWNAQNLEFLFRKSTNTGNAVNNVPGST